MKALARFSEPFERVPRAGKKELVPLVLQKTLVSHDHMELALYGKPPELSEMPQETARSETSNWLPGRVSGSVVLWDWLELGFRPSTRGRLVIATAG